MKLLITTQIIDKNDPMLGFFHRWVEEFAKHFDRIDVICLKEGTQTLPANVQVHSLGKESGENRFKYTWRFYKNFWKLYIKQDVDFVFFHMGAVYNIMAAPFFLIRKIKKTKFYWWKTHGHINLTGKTALLFVDNVFTAIKESFPIDTRKKVVVGHAIDTNLFKLGDRVKKEDTILFVGRLSRSKRVEQVIEIVSKLKDREFNIKAKIIGDTAENDYEEELRSLVKKLKFEEEIEFVGGVPQESLVKEYQCSRIFINPSDNDGLDKVVLEAMASGCVPLTGNLSFENILSAYGLFMKKGDIDGYVKEVEKIFALTDEEYNALVTKLRSDVVRQHTIDTLSNRIFNTN